MSERERRAFDEALDRLEGGLRADSSADITDARLRLHELYDAARAALATDEPPSIMDAIEGLGGWSAQPERRKAQRRVEQMPMVPCPRLHCEVSVGTHKDERTGGERRGGEVSATGSEVGLRRLVAALRRYDLDMRTSTCFECNEDRTKHNRDCPWYWIKHAAVKHGVRAAR